MQILALVEDIFSDKKQSRFSPALRLSINPLGGVGGLQPSDYQSDLSDMCGEVGSLA